jgi:hypothetical protein
MSENAALGQNMPFMDGHQPKKRECARKGRTKRKGARERAPFAVVFGWYR